MNISIIIGISIVIVALVIAGLGIRLIAGKKTALRAGSCSGKWESSEKGFSCCCIDEGRCISE